MATRHHITVLLCMLLSGQTRGWTAVNCSGQLEGLVTDPSGSIVEGAVIALRGFASVVAKTDGQGRYRVGCAPQGVRVAAVSAKGFAQTLRPVSVLAGKTTTLDVQLEIATARSTVNATLDDVQAPRTVTPMVVLSAPQTEGLADDPADFRSQLQALASATAGLPGKPSIYVDGFTSDIGMPPKSAIQEIRINADQFSAQYQNPPFQGGQVEIVTKAAGKGIHGSLGIAYGASGLNARDSLAPVSDATGKKGLTASLAFPIIPNRFDLSFDFEKRLTDEFSVVHAFTPQANGSMQPFDASAPAPQSFDNGSVRSHVQLDPLTSMIFSYSFTRGRDTNQGVGGLVLPEAGYTALNQSQNVRVSLSRFLTTKILFESRAGYSWNNASQNPNSTATSVVVSGAYIGGGSTSQNTGVSKRTFELEDEISVVAGKHSIRAGVAASRCQNYFIDAQGDNGLLTYVGSTAVAYSVTVGDPRISVLQWRASGYIQDQWRVSPKLTLSLGLRQAVQTSPRANGLWAPRLGLAWSPAKKDSLVLRLRYGQFLQPLDETLVRDSQRINGQQGYQALFYDPNILNPLASAVVVEDIRILTPHLSQTRIAQTQGSVEKEFKGQWKVQSQLYWTSTHRMMRSVSVPDASGAGNQFIYEQNGRVVGPTLYVGLSQVAKKHFTFVSGYIYSKVKSDADTADFFPQNSSNPQGEFVQPTWLSTHRVFGFGQFNLPWKVNLTSFVNLSSGQPFNVTTGSDLNGDGVFNDRPGLLPGPAPSALPTPFGWLTTNGTGNVLTRDVGRMPASVGLDLSVSRKFKLKTPASSLDSVPTMLLSVKAKNALNHTNITSVDGVLNSPLFLHGVSADASRRLEFGAKFEF